MIRLRRFLLPALFAALVSACSSGNDAATPGRFAQGLVQDQIKARLGPKGPDINPIALLTRESLAGITDHLTRISIPSRDVLTLIYIKQARGPYQVWFSTDNISITTHSGLVSATAGLGNDIFGVIDPQMIAALEGKRFSSPARRVNRVMNGDNQIIDHAFDCTITDLGAATKTVLSVNHATRHLRQSCTGNLGEFTNDYWVGGGVVWASRQWFGPEIGYVEFERLIL